MLIRAALLLIGFTAVIAQIVLLRELIVVFSGNEISLGLALAGWLLWTAFGSAVLGRFTARTRAPRQWMAALEVLAAVALPLTILLVRMSKGIFQSVPGEILGPLPMLITSFASLGVFCAISGWLFAAGSTLYAQESRASTAEAGAAVYLLEGLGSAIGGLLASLALIRYFTAVEIAVMLAGLNFAVAAGLLVPVRGPRRAAALAVAALLALLSAMSAPRLESWSLARLWRGFHVIETRNSIYGNLALVDVEGSTSLFENGLAVFDVPNPEAAEEAVHYALLQHPSPGSLLLIGGGVNGSVAQALQHPSMRRLDYVELDPEIPDLARRRFPKEWAPIQFDSRVRVHPTDGRLFLKTTAAKYDAIIVNLPDPRTAQLNRFYTVEFFREAAGKLTPGGVLSFGLTGAENYISPELARFLRCIHKTLLEVFPGVVAFPGPAVRFFASRRRGALTANADELIARLRQRGLKTTYVREYMLPFRLTPDRMQDLQSQIRPRPETPVNRDFAPIAYYFNVALWSRRFQRDSSGWFDAIARADFTAVTAIVGLGLLGAALLLQWLLPADRRPAASAGFCAAAMGFSLIGLEMLLLLGFQAIYGYVYHQLAIVIACFMAGMALGSWVGLRGRPGRACPAPATLAVLQIVAAASGIVLVLLFDALAGVTSRTGLFLVSQALFPLLALLSGLLGGFQFPIASRAFFGDSGEEPRSPGTLYGLDLVGACAGAVLFSAYLIPVFGLRKTALLMAVVNLAPAALSALVFRSRRGSPLQTPAP